MLDSYPELVAHNTNPWGEEELEDGRLFGYAMRRYMKRQWNEVCVIVVDLKSLVWIVIMCSEQQGFLIYERVSCVAECRCCGKAIDQILSREELVMKNYFNLLDF